MLVLVMTLSVFTACEIPDSIKDILGGIIPNPDPTPTPDDGKVTVTWYQGAKELRVDRVEKGTILEAWEPEVEGKEFKAWYAEASCTELFDFTKPIEEDTDIFAAFKSTVYTPDDHQYYLIGAGAGDMAASNWNHNTESLYMEKQDVENANVYKIRIKMYAGDKFQICYTGTWDGQMGIGYMKGAEYCDGINAYDKTEYTAADKKVAQVLDAEGNVVFTGSDEYGKGFEVWNIWLADGQDGIYEFTFTTNPDDMGNNVLEWELVEKLEPMTETHKMYLIGTFNNWKPADLTDDWLLTANDTKTEYTGIFTFAEAVQLKIFNSVSSDWIGYEGNNLALEAGTYAFKYSTESNSFTYEALDYYIVGTFLDAEGNAVNFAVKDGVTPKLTLVDGKYVVTLTATDVTENNNYTWIATQGKPGVMAIAVVYGSSIAIQDWYKDAANNGDNYYLAAGEWTVTFDPEAKTVAITEATTTPPVVDPPHTHDWSDATCTEPQKCECGATQGEALGHDFVDHFCSRCHVPEVPTEEGKVTVYFTVKDSAELNSFNRYYLTGSLTGWAAGVGAPAFTRLEGTDIYYVLVDNVNTPENEYKIVIGTVNDGLKWSRAWTTTSAPDYGEKNCKFTYTAGSQYLDLGEHSFATQPSVENVNRWSVIGHFENTDLYKEWRYDMELLPTDTPNVFETNWINVNAETDNFKVRADFNWDEQVGDNGDNIRFSKDGTYKIQFNTETRTVTIVEKHTVHEDLNGDFICDNVECNEMVVPAEGSTLTISQALVLASLTSTSNKYYISGTIEVVVNTTYGNMYIKDTEGNQLYIYGTYSTDGSVRYDALEQKPVAGDEITLYGALSVFQGTIQMKSGWVTALTHEHNYSEATCKKLPTCACGATTGELADHTFEDGFCTVCGDPDPTYTGPVQSVTVKDDFNTVTADNSYADRKTISGWTAKNAAVVKVGESTSFTINGKTSALGSITSPVFTNGIKSIKFSYANTYSEKNGVDITINIYQNGEVVATKQLDVANDNVTKGTAYEFSWVLENAVSGEFTIEIVNNHPTNSAGSNKDRVSIFDIEFVTNP